MLAAGLLVLSGCDKCELVRDQAVPTPDASGAARARLAVEQNIRQSSQVPDRVLFRGVTVWPQAIPQRVAVCGQVNPFPNDASLFVPFVSVVTMPTDGSTAKATPQFDQHVGTTTSEASRAYVALTAYCFENGGPASGPLQSNMRLPPMPDTIQEPKPLGATVPVSSSPLSSGDKAPAPPPTPLAPGVAADRVAATGTVSMRQNGNLHSDPHGGVARIVPRGTVMHVFAQAAGGWYQVGDTAPWGWVHESMLDQR